MKSIKVKSIKPTGETKKVYDIQVDDTANYILKDGVVSHNSGIIFASSIVVASEKFKLKEDREGKKGTDVLGIRSKFKVMKTRYGRPYEVANTHIRFDTGLEPFSGCLDYFERVGIVQKEGNKLKYITKDGEEIKEFRKGFTDSKLKIIIDEWDYEKYRLISADTDELAYDELAPTESSPTEEPSKKPVNQEIEE